MGQSVPLACQDWANTKAAYRFFSNSRVNENDILKGHFESTSSRVAATDGPVLLLHDTTEFSYQRVKPKLIGSTCVVNSGRDQEGRLRFHKMCGILMHSSLAVTTEGLPLGLTAVKFWTRKKFKGCQALKRKINPTRVPIEKKESIRWLDNARQATELIRDANRCVHIGDRESDIYELFCLTQEIGAHFVIRTCVDRLTGDGSHTVKADMKDAEVKGQYKVEVRDHHGNPVKVNLRIKYRRLRVLPPIGKQKQYPELNLTIIHAKEEGKPKNRKKIEWKLITDLPVRSRKDAIEKLQWYALRWKIEVFHKILKSGCKAEEAKLRTADRLANLISVFCILSWRVFWMTMLNRSAPGVSQTVALTNIEIGLLDRLVKDKHRSRLQPKRLPHYLTKIAQLGGYLARASDPPPGNMAMWRGLVRLTDIEIGAIIGAKLVGN